MPKLINQIEKAYIALRDDKVTMPDRQFIETKNGFILIGASYIKDSGYFGVRQSTYISKDGGVDGISSEYALYDENNGTLLARIDFNKLVDQRTGAKSAVAVKYLARKDSKVLGILGMGKQARTQIAAIVNVMPIEKVLLWSRNSEKHQDLVQFVKNGLNLDCEICEPKEIAQNSDIIVDATYAREPLIKDEDIKNGTLCIGINHEAFAVEFSAETLSRGKVFVDFHQSKHAGTIQNAIKEGVIKDEDIIELKNIVKSEDFRINETSNAYFHSGGTSIEDLSVAICVYESNI